LDAVSYSIGNLFYLEEGTTGAITSQTNIYKKCWSVSSGGIFYLPPSTSLSDSNSEFHQNTSPYGSCVWCDSCSLTFIGSKFWDNLAYDGGVIFMQNTATALFSAVSMSYSYSRHYGGGIYIGGTGASSITFSDCATTI
jgi:hypothetical protein